MKNRLERIKTTYNQQGNYDRDLYFKQQKSVYKRQIDFSNRVDEITEQQFTFKPLQIAFLNSSALKDEQKFKDIRKIFTEYNKNVIQSGGAPVNGLHLKKVVMESMLKFMRLMLLAPDTGTKKLILDIAYHWFIQHLDPKSHKKSSKQLQKQIKQLILEKQLLPIDIVNKQLILNKINEQLHPYKIKARTMYKQLDDPSIQLDNYNTHKLEFVNNKYQDKGKGKDDRKTGKKWIDTVKFPKIQNLVYEIQVLEEEKKLDEKPVEDNTKNENQVPVQIKLDAEGKPIQQSQLGQQAKAAENPNEPQQDLDFGEPPDAQPEPQQFQQPEDKKRGKLDPLLKVFLLERIREKEKGEVVCEKIREKEINKKNLSYQEDLLSGEYLRQWARKRARLKSQIAKKSQAMRGGDRISRGKVNETEKFLQNDIQRIKMRSQIAQYKKNITAVQMPQDKLNSEPGLSLFDRRRVKTQASHKPFSSILSDNSTKAQQNQMLTQMQEIKQKFSKYKAYTPMDKLIKGLAPPDRQYFNQDSDKIVWPNSQILSNPFIKVAKKKKKKKKK